nr:multicopper oxidase domain-containing protein [Allobranchiibius sp. GilTou38]
MAPEVFAAKPGQRVRIRLINAAGDTAYRVGIPGLQLTVTHTDGFPIVHQDVDALVLGMGERFDVLVTVPDHPVALTVLAEGKSGGTFAVLDAGRGARPSVATLPAILGGRVIEARMTAADPSVRLASRTADVVHTLALTGSMSKYDWGINGRRYDQSDPFASAVTIRAGQRVRLDYTNRTMMWHPMHLHGHTFQVGATGPRKDTVIVKPMETVSVFFDADNPGQWLTHCHNAYHAARGMMAVVSYVQ